jgi:glycosyltransferase involved in cell wall biosynthesis
LLFSTILGVFADHLEQSVAFSGVHISDGTISKEHGTCVPAPRALPAPASVLHIGKFYRPHTGGMETHLAYLVLHQSATMSVEVVVANDRPVSQTNLLDGAKITRVASFGTVASQPLCPLLPLELSGRKEALVHLHLPNPWAAQAYLMSGHKGKLIVTHHADMLGRPFLRQLVSPFVRRVMDRAAAIIVTSRRYLESSQELVPYRHKCHVIPLGIDVDALRPNRAADVADIYAKYGQRLLLAVGRLVPYKGFAFLLRAMQHIDATLLLIGTGPLRAELHSAVSTLGLGHKVHLLGHIGDTLPYYKAAKVLVFPSISRAESFGLVQVEAMAAGTPVVNTEIDSGGPEVSINGETGITVPPRDPQALADAVKVLLDNEETRLTFAHAARLRAHQEFSAQRMAERTLGLYKSIFGAA